MLVVVLIVLIKAARSETRLFSGQDAFQPRDRIPRTPAKTEPTGKNGFILFQVLCC